MRVTLLSLVTEPAGLLYPLFCFASVLFSLLDKFFPYSEQKANETVLNTALI